MTDSLPARGVTHRVKIDSHWWIEIKAGRKTSELRRDDRDYQIGDRIQFIVNGHSYIAGERRITHVLKNAEGLTPGYVVLSLNNPDYDYHVEAAERRLEWLTTAERRIAALKGAMTKQRNKYDQLLIKYRAQHDSLCDYRTELLQLRKDAADD